MLNAPVHKNKLKQGEELQPLSLMNMRWVFVYGKARTVRTLWTQLEK